MNHIKITSLKTGDSFMFSTTKNISEAVLLKQKAYDKWRRNKRDNRHRKFYDIMKTGNYKSEYVDGDNGTYNVK